MAQRKKEAPRVQPPSEADAQRDKLRARIIKNRKDIQDLIERVAEVQAEGAKKDIAPQDVKIEDDLFRAVLTVVMDMESVIEVAKNTFPG
jgi:hypothetical protein